MGRPRISMSLTPENVLARMTPGLTYSAVRIANRFCVPTTTIRPMLDEMVAAGQIELSHEQAKMLGFRRPLEKNAEAERIKMATSIATPPIHVRLDGELTGYDAEFRRRAELCMMVRTR